MENKKLELIKLREKGYSYQEISEILNVPRSTVSSYCIRNNIKASGKNIVSECKNCKEMIIDRTGKKRRLFCCDECRENWWNLNQDKVNKKAFYKKVCKNCKTEFKTYGNKNQVYCSHSCYINYRYKKGGK